MAATVKQLKEIWRKRREPTVELYIKKRTKKIGKCLIWIGGRDGRYGWFEYKGKSGIASRLVWQAMIGPIPKGLCVLHKCDNPKCVNWKGCLYLGTKKDNRRDFMKRHPRAKQLIKNLIKNGTKKVQKFWDDMTPKQRKDFIKKRAKIQAWKYPLGARNGKAYARIDY